MKLGNLQHERGFSQVDAWMSHWESLLDDRSKADFLLMLKERGSRQKDEQTIGVFRHLAGMWIDESYP